MSIDVQLPDDARSFIDAQVASGRFVSASAFIADLVEQARRRVEIERVDQLLLTGLNSGAGVDATPDYWRKKKEELSQKYDRADKP